MGKKKARKARKVPRKQKAAKAQQATAPREDQEIPLRHVCLVCGALILITLAVYWQTHGFDFVNYYDHLYVTENPHTQAGLTWDNLRWAFTTGHAANWHPLTWLSYMLDVQLFGVSAPAHHVVNVLWHVLNSVLLFLVLCRMTARWDATKALWPSAFVAALFALHPLHVESVAWIAERKDVLSTFFWLLTMAAYAHYVQRPSVRRYLMVAAPFALGLMAKPMLVTLPAVLLLLDYWPLGRLDLAGAGPRKVGSSFARLAFEKAPLLALTVLSSVATIAAQGSRGGVVPYDVIPLSVRVGNALVAYAQYILRTLWPVRLAVYYPHLRDAMPLWQPIVSALLLGGATALVLLRPRRLPYLAVGWFWYLGTLVPVIGIVQVGDQAFADRYTYVPLIGVFIMAAWGIAHLAAKWRLPRPVLAAGAAATLAALCVGAWTQIGHWKDSRTLFEHALEVTSGNFMAHKALGVVLTDDAGEYEAAAQHLRKAIELDPGDAAGYFNLGNALHGMGKADEAIEQYRKAIQIDPHYVAAHYNLGNVFAEQKKLPEAAAAFEAVLKIQPGHAAANNNLGSALVLQGKLEEALSRYRKALDADPDYLDACCNLGYTLTKLGRPEEAVQAYSRALRVDPTCEKARKALADLQEQGIGN